AEVVQCAPANRIGILVLRKGFAIPSHRIRGLIETPGCAAIPSISLGTVMRPARMLRWSVETDIRQTWLENWKHNFKGLNGAVQIHVKESVLIVPYSGVRPCYLVTDEENPITTRIRLNLVYYRARSCPGLDSRLHSDGRTDR